MKIKLRSLLVIAMTVALAATSQARGIQEESLGDKIIKFLAGPSPTPHKRLKRPTPTPEPSALPETIATSTPASPAEGPEARDAQAQYSEPVRRSPIGTKALAPSATIFGAEISGYENYPPGVRKIIDLGLNLSTQNLTYKYNSADPAKGGMDCSGFIHYVLSQCGIKDVPRDARDQYIWVRRAGNFLAVLAQRDDTFELDALKPGDLLFWASPSSVTREPDITQTMIFLGRDKTTNQRIMVGANKAQTYKGRSRFGVSVFDFKVGPSAPKSEREPAPVFVGYGSIPGLSAE